ncbi:antitoxin VbhA family protein [Actinobacillus equuli]|uniref:antitoxin VbhA family protein n=1 Tax=Actinobacillus equuli TaxID=718 RepID=UPI0024423A13|nr:antitoxin VbhA family protein [Actinobacillus equuli]WGE42271.1 antitoxin VbhA family protein [Actinobacillus equuli subsp. haemolyticus]
MIEQERKFRLDAVQAAIDNNLLEGLYLDQQTLNLFNAWIENQISFDEVEKVSMKYAESDRYTEALVLYCDNSLLEKIILARLEPNK